MGEGFPILKERTALEAPSGSTEADSVATVHTHVQVVEREDCQGRSNTSASYPSTISLHIERHWTVDVPQKSEGVSSRYMRTESGELN